MFNCICRHVLAQLIPIANLQAIDRRLQEGFGQLIDDQVVENYMAPAGDDPDHDATLSWISYIEISEVFVRSCFRNAPASRVKQGILRLLHRNGFRPGRIRVM